MFARLSQLGRAVFLASGLVLSSCVTNQDDSAGQVAAADGIVKVKSAYAMDETVARLEKDIADKGIKFFMAVDQAKLAADVGITLRPSTLLIFSNPALGSQFMTSNPIAGIDWPVRLLVIEDAHGDVWAVYTDFDYIKHRHRIADRDAAFKMASTVIASITSSVAAR